jgi:hypothetical protein
MFYIYISHISKIHHKSGWVYSTVGIVCMILQSKNILLKEIHVCEKVFVLEIFHI